MSEERDDYVFEQIGDVNEAEYKEKLGWSGKEEVTKSREETQEAIHRLAEQFIQNPIAVEMMLARVINPQTTIRQLGILIHRDQHAVLRAIKKESKSLEGVGNLLNQNTPTCIAQRLRNKKVKLAQALANVVKS